ncbi:MAG: PorT family protein [Tannerellaceae bacterium]|jgi:hypothetical protein|nr:PorT family protein [Tannerellaceae bacterium]
MKRILIIAAIIFAATISQAKAQVYSDIGIRAGVNFSVMPMDANVQNILGDPEFKLGFVLGLAWDIHFTDEVYLMSGLDLTQKGYKSKHSYSENVLGIPASAELNMAANPLFLQVPLYFAYKIEIDRDTRFVPRIGPWIGYGVGGKLSMNASAGILGFEAGGSLPDTDLFGDSGFMKNFNYGLGVGAGIEFGRLNFYLNYELGLANLASDDLRTVFNLTGTDYSIKTNTVSIAVGYRIY